MRERKLQQQKEQALQADQVLLFPEQDDFVECLDRGLERFAEKGSWKVRGQLDGSLVYTADFTLRETIERDMAISPSLPKGE